MQLASIEQGLQDLKVGKFLIVVDDEDRENEGDLVMPAEFRHPRGCELHGHLRSWAIVHADDRQSACRAGHPHVAEPAF